MTRNRCADLNAQAIEVVPDQPLRHLDLISIVLVIHPDALNFVRIRRGAPDGILLKPRRAPISKFAIENCPLPWRQVRVERLVKTNMAASMESC